MTTRDALSIALPAIALAFVLFLPGTPRWGRRPWFVTGPPRRGPLAAFCAVLLLFAVIHAAA
jgi:hypothetical protein